MSERFPTDPHCPAPGATHTPGPWWCEKGRYSETLTGQLMIREGREGGAYIAHAHPRSADGQPDAQAHANAALISAAPDLLDALRAIVGPDLTYLDGSVMTGISREKIIAARTAIAKATTVFPW
ncbi:MAG TPA: hypothetical protein VGE74_12360 [Gemmata sp.]